MSRVLLLGSGGLPDSDLDQVDFPRLRTWHFLRGIVAAGHQVWLVAPTLRTSTGQEARSATSGQAGSRAWTEHHLEDRTLHVLAVTPAELDRPDLPARWLEHSKAERVVTAGPFAVARAAGRLPPGIPTWIDLPGDLMAEAQLRAWRTGSPTHLHHAHRILLSALARGDAFSVIGQRQRDATLGQLGLIGRLSADCLGCLPVHVIPVGVEPAWRRWAQSVAGQPRDPQTIAWPGALNTWSDGERMFAACARLLEARPQLRVIVTGGQIPGHEEAAYQWLTRRVQGHPQRTRWILTGWVSPERAAELLCVARVALSIDRECLEAHLGSRTRLLYGAALGVPWVTSPGSELADLLIAQGLATAPADLSVDGIAAALARQLDAPPLPPLAELERLGSVTPGGETRGETTDDTLSPARAYACARARLLERYEGGQLLQPLLAWLASPTLLPRGEDLQGALVERIRELEGELAAVQNSLTWRMLGRVHRRLKRWRGESRAERGS